MRRSRNACYLSIMCAVVMSVVGCTSMQPNRVAQPLDAREKVLPGLRKPWPSVGASTEPVDYIGLSARDEFVLKEAGDSDPLPEFRVRGFSYTNAALFDVLRTLISQGDQSITLAYDVETAAVAKRHISAYNVKGTFASVLESLSETSGFFYRYKNGVLRVATDRQYVITLPPVSELMESIPAMLRSLGGVDVLVDKSARLVTFRANKGAYEKIQSYLDYLRNNRSLITYDCFIWEVVLNDQSQMGINWRDFPSGLAGDAMTSGVAANYVGADGSRSAAVNLTNASSLASGVGVGLTVKSSRFALSTMIDFLRTQGTINNISQPKISLLSGTTAQFRNGTSVQYISRIAPGTVVNGTFIAGSTETASLQTGVTMTIAGDISDETVFSDVSLKIADLVRMEKQQVVTSQGGATTISLPVSADREVNTRVRVRPGDAIIIGGINLQNVSNTFTGLGVVPTASDKEVQRSELVVVLVPRVTYFVKQGDNTNGTNNGTTNGATSGTTNTNGTTNGAVDRGANGSGGGQGGSENGVNSRLNGVAQEE